MENKKKFAQAALTAVVLAAGAPAVTEAAIEGTLLAGHCGGKGSCGAGGYYSSCNGYKQASCNGYRQASCNSSRRVFNAPAQQGCNNQYYAPTYQRHGCGSATDTSAIPAQDAAVYHTETTYQPVTPANQPVNGAKPSNPNMNPNLTRGV